MIAERAHRDVNVAEFKTAGLPKELDWLDISCPQDEQYILRMAVRAEGGQYLIPRELAWLYPMLIHAQVHQHQLGVDHPFCYITVRHGLVRSQTDDQWHVDGFSTKVAHLPEQNYVWTSTDGTEYADLSVDVPDDFDPLRHNINHYLEQFVTPERVSKCADKTIYCMDPYIVHRRPVSTAGTMRTFVRLSFVPIEINDINNTQNSMLPRHYTADGVAHRNTLTHYPG
jgi:hypothetical protein